MSTKKRLIFALLYYDGIFCQSRNFQCQKVGNFEWLFNNYNFSHIAGYLDELVVLNVNPSEESHPKFLKMVERIVDNVFVPVAIGGGIYSVDKALQGLNSGADKVVLNSGIRNDTKTVESIINKLGSQSVVASIDYKSKNDTPMVYNWEEKAVIEGMALIPYVQQCQELGFGEILLNSVEKDGTGFGLDLDVVKEVSGKCKLPLIVMGGAGKYQHFEPAYKIPAVDAVTTANLLNFIGNALPDTRVKLLDTGIDLARFRNQKLD